jgi:hypothetical protein
MGVETKTPIINCTYNLIFIPKVLHVSDFYSKHICFELEFICAWNYKFHKRAGVTAHSSLYLNSHRAVPCTEKPFHKELKIGLTRFTDFSQGIIKLPITLGKQLSPARSEGSIAMLFDVSHSHFPWVRDIFETDGCSVYSDYINQHLT